MAALPDTPHAEVVELAQVTVPELDVLLEDEIRAWRQRFAWDFRPSADLLRRFLQMHSLSGYALRSAGRIAGYAYHVCEGRKGLIGDFYVLNTNSRNADELTLLGAIVGGLMRTPGVRRIESQLMMQRGGLTHPPFSRFLTRHDRFFMQMETAGARKVPIRPATVPVTV